MLDSDLFQLLRPSAKKSRLKGEAYIQAQLVDFLKGASLTKELKGVWFHIPNGIADGNHFSFGKTLKEIGKIAGAPDICFVYDGGALFMELKTDKGKLSQYQRLFKLWCEHHNIHYAIIRSVEDAKETLTKYGFLKKI